MAERQDYAKVQEHVAGLVYEALKQGKYTPWEFEPVQYASERYMRNHMDLNVLEQNQRFPKGEP